MTNPESTTTLSSKAILVTIATYGVPDADGNVLGRGQALDIFDMLCDARDVHRANPSLHTGYRVVDVGIEGNEVRGSVYAWVDVGTKKDGGDDV